MRGAHELGDPGGHRVDLAHRVVHLARVTGHRVVHRVTGGRVLAHRVGDGHPPLL